MNRNRLILATLAIAACLAATAPVLAQNQTQNLHLPLASPRAEVSQNIGLTTIDVVYHRPAVNERDIWANVVPAGQVWRTGANENTTIAFSTDVTVEGQALAAGTYGLHSIPGEDEWQIIFSHDTTAWGSFSYDEANDALRVAVTPEKAAHEERMSIAFDDVSNEGATVAIRWAELRVPFRVEIDLHGTVMASIREELKGLSQFFWNGPNQAANYAVTNDQDLEEAMQWVEASIQAETRWENLNTKAQILAKTGDEAQSEQIIAEALELANPGQLHGYGRQLIGQDKQDEAMEIFKMNAEKHADTWFVDVGLARGYSALGEFDKAAAAMAKAHERAPEPQKAYIQGLHDRLAAGEDIN